MSDISNEEYWSDVLHWARAQHQRSLDEGLENLGLRDVIAEITRLRTEREELARDNAGLRQSLLDAAVNPDEY